MTESNELANIKKFYDGLSQKMQSHQFRFLLVNIDQKKYGLDKTIFIPFDPNDPDGKNGYGLYLFMHDIQNPSGISHTMIAACTLQLTNPENKSDVARLLHEINLNLPVPGWILNDKENLLHYKFLFSGIENYETVSDTYLTLIAEIVHGISKSFPLLKETIEGTRFGVLRDAVGPRLAH